MSNVTIERPKLPTLEQIREWFFRLLGRKPVATTEPVLRDEPQLQAPVECLPPQQAPLPTSAARPKRASTRRTQIAPDAETFAGLLDGLDDSFHTMKIPAIKGNWLPRADIRALHKMGLFIPTPFEVVYEAEPSIDCGISLPMIASCLVIQSKYDTADNVHPRFAFAIKQPRLPENVEQIAGTVYQFGVSVQLSEEEKDPNSPPRLFWCYAYVVIEKSGRIRVPQELRPVVHSITHRRKQPEGSRRSTFVSQQWQRPRLFTTDKTQGQAEYSALLTCIFRQLIVWWSTRDEQWSVGVRKDGKRATFSIRPEHTAAYFCDRDKTIAVNGTAKKIIHYVREHERSNGSVVRAHVRGLREFDWRGYNCSVIAPKLNGALTTMCALEPVEAEPDALDTMDTLSAAMMLADAEDHGHRRAA